MLISEERKMSQKPKYQMVDSADGVMIVRNSDQHVMWSYTEAFRQYAEEHLKAVNSVWEDKEGSNA